MKQNFDKIIDELEEKIEISDKNHAEIVDLIKAIHKLLLAEKQNNIKLEYVMKKYNIIESDIVQINVGGKKFSTYRANLVKKIPKPNTDEFYAPSILEGFMSGIADIKYDEEKAIFIDRSPKYFDEILNYLRVANTEEVYELPSSTDDLNGVLREAEYYKLEGLIALFNFFSDSSILNKKQSLDLINLCEFSTNDKWKLLYRGSLHGFASADFHGKCDSIKRTLTIVESTRSNIFGGVTYATWDGANVWKLDLNAFLFSLVNADNKPIKMKYDNFTSVNTTIQCAPLFGPCFGAQKSLNIVNNANVNTDSVSNLGINFIHPKYENNSPEAKLFLAGSNNFQIREIEVYHLI